MGKQKKRTKGLKKNREKATWRNGDYHHGPKGFLGEVASERANSGISRRVEHWDRRTRREAAESSRDRRRKASEKTIRFIAKEPPQRQVKTEPGKAETGCTGTSAPPKKNFSKKKKEKGRDA